MNIAESEGERTGSKSPLTMTVRVEREVDGGAQLSVLHILASRMRTMGLSFALVYVFCAHLSPLVFHAELMPQPRIIIRCHRVGIVGLLGTSIFDIFQPLHKFDAPVRRL